jgi:hypothetical protein
MTGRPLTVASVGLLPLLLATVSVLPVADGRGGVQRDYDVEDLVLDGSFHGIRVC